MKQYAAYIKRNAKYISVYATIDKIPGVFGKRRTYEELVDSARQSYENHQRLKNEFGLTPIPVYHQGEPIEWLAKLLEDGEPYIGIACAKDASRLSQQHWLDHTFTLLTDRHGRPYAKTHGFGITNVRHLLRYPWFTADSTTWALSAGFGQVYLPRFVGGKPNYDVMPHILAVSERDAVETSGLTYTRLGDAHRANLHAYLEQVGVSVEQIRYDPYARRQVTLFYFQELCRNHDRVRFEHRGSAFTFDANSISVKRRAVKFDKFAIMYATGMTRQFSAQLTDNGIGTRLLSYFDLKDLPDDALRQYVITGGGDGYKQRIPQLPRGKPWNEEYKSFRRLSLVSRTEAIQDEA